MRLIYFRNHILYMNDSSMQYKDKRQIESVEQARAIISQEIDRERKKEIVERNIDRGLFSLSMKNAKSNAKGDIRKEVREDFDIENEHVKQVLVEIVDEIGRMVEREY